MEYLNSIKLKNKISIKLLKGIIKNEQFGGWSGGASDKVFALHRLT